MSLYLGHDLIVLGQAVLKSRELHAASFPLGPWFFAALLIEGIVLRGVWAKKSWTPKYAWSLATFALIGLVFQFLSWGLIHPQALFTATLKLSALAIAFNDDLIRPMKGRPNFGPLTFRDAYERWSIPTFAFGTIAVFFTLLFRTSFPIYRAPQKLVLAGPSVEGLRSRSFPFQIDTPSSATLFYVRPDEGYLVLQVGQERWMLDRTNYFAESIEDAALGLNGLRRFLDDRFGSIPRMLKALLLGDSPAQFVVLENSEILCAAAMELGSDSATIKAYFWDRQGSPRGMLSVLRADPGRDLATWVRSLNVSLAPPKGRMEGPEQNGSGTMLDRGLFLGFQAMAAPSDRDRVLEVVRYLDSTGQSSLARSHRKALLIKR